MADQRAVGQPNVLEQAAVLGDRVLPTLLLERELGRPGRRRLAVFGSVLSERAARNQRAEERNCAAPGGSVQNRSSKKKVVIPPASPRMVWCPRLMRKSCVAWAAAASGRLPRAIGEPAVSAAAVTERSTGHR